MGPGHRGLAEGGAEGGAPGTPGTEGHGWVRRLRPPSARGLRPSKPQLGLTPPEKQEPEGGVPRGRGPRCGARRGDGHSGAQRGSSRELTRAGLCHVGTGTRTRHPPCPPARSEHKDLSLGRGPSGTGRGVPVVSRPTAPPWRGPVRLCVFGSGCIWTERIYWMGR